MSEIRAFPDLSQPQKKTQSVTAFDRLLLKLVVILVRVMKSQPHVIGIAEPLCSISKAVAIVDFSKRGLKTRV